MAEIGGGLLLLVGVGAGDTTERSRALAEKCARLRVFADGAGKMNRSLLDFGGEALGVSQFTLLADMSRGRRPSFAGAAAPDEAVPVLAEFVRMLEGLGVHTQQGRFGAHMLVDLVNDGPVTMLLEG